MRVKSRLLTLSAVALLGVLSGCGTSGGTSSSPTTSATPQSATPSSTMTTATPTTTTPSPAATASPKPPAKKAVSNPKKAVSNPPAAKAVLIAIKDFKFAVPPSVGAGSKVLVMNKDGENHTVTSAVQGAFDVTAEAGGKAISFTAPTKPGSYPFVCKFHANMKGTLVVK